MRKTEKKINGTKIHAFDITTVSKIVEQFNGEMLLPEINYTVPPMPIFGNECYNSDVVNSHSLSHPPIYATKVTDFKVIGGAAFPIIQNRSVIHQNYSSDKWETWEQASGKCSIHTDQNLIGYISLSAPYKYEHQVINLIGNGSFNYAHWITEYLPQLVLLKQSGVDLSAYKILLDEASFPSMFQALYLLGIKKDQIILVGALALNEFPSALWVSPVANIVFQRPKALLKDGEHTLAAAEHAIFHPQVIQATKEVFLNLVNNDDFKKAPERIFLKRITDRTFNLRRVTNEQEVESLLESYGFYSVDPSTLSFTEQILLFSQAKFIVSASGAALVNMIWAPAGAKVAVLMNDSKVANYWYFGNIAFSAGHQLSYVLGEIVENGCWSDINHSDFRISISSLNDALNYFGLNTQASHAQSLEQVFKYIFEIALEYQKNEQLDKAASAYKNLLRLQPMHAEASYNLGLIEFYNQLKDSAIIRFELAVQLKSECEQYWVSYIDALMDKGSIDIAVDALALGQNFGLRASTAQMMADSYLKEFEK